MYETVSSFLVNSTCSRITPFFVCETDCFSLDYKDDKVNLAFKNKFYMAEK